MTRPGKPLVLGEAPWFNLRAIVDYSPTAALAAPEERAALGAFLGGYGVGLPSARSRDEAADPVARLRAFLSRTRGAGTSRFSDGTFPAVNLGDAPETCLAEVSHALGRALAETAAAMVKTQYFMLARFVLGGEVLDVRRGFPALHRPDDWAPAQAFGRQAWAEGRQGILFRAVRRRGAENVAVLRKELVRSGVRLQVVGLRWDGFGIGKV